MVSCKLVSNLKPLQLKAITNNINGVSFSIAFSDTYLHQLTDNQADLAISPAQDLPYPLHSDFEVIALYHDFENIFQPSETNPLQGFWAVVVKRNREDLKQLFAGDNNILTKSGRVDLVGFGPGDPELLTIKAERLIKNADIIFYDDLTNKEYLETIETEKVYVGKRSGKHSFEQQAINYMLLKSAREGKNVVRLKGGDPMLFAHAAEEIEYLQRCFINVGVTPGISAAFAAAAALRIPLTQRKISSSVAFINGHSKKIEMPNASTLVYYMASSNLNEIRNVLINKGLATDTPVMLVENVSKPTEKQYITTLNNLSQNYQTPLIVIVGEVGRR